MAAGDGRWGWLLEDAADPSIRYFALQRLLDRSPEDPEVRAARAAIGRSGWAAKILDDQSPDGHWEQFRGDGGELYGPKYIATNWRLIVLAELGATAQDPRIARGVELLFRHWSGPEGVFGEPGSELCITGNVARILTRFGLGEDPRTRASLDWLVRAQKEDGGWHCFESSSGTLDGWEAMAAFAEIPKAARSAPMERAIARGAEFYLERGLLRESDGSTYAPWRRLHYPNHYYYDLLVGLDFLTALGFGDDRRLAAPLELLESKRSDDGRWKLEAVHPDLEPDDPYHPRTPVYPFQLEHVGLPSRWITLRAETVLRRAGRG